MSILNEQLPIEHYERLLDAAAPQLAQPLISGRSGGVFNTVERQPDGDLDSVGEWRPGLDLISDMDLPNSVANNRFMARSRKGEAKLQTMYIIAEVDESLPIGNVTMTALSRLAIAASAIGGERQGSKLLAAFTSEVGSPLHPGYYGQAPNKQMLLRRFDNYLLEIADEPEENPDALHRELVKLTNGTTGFKPELNSLVVISDFVNGAQRDEEGNLVGFSWEGPLVRLHRRLKDRLKIFQLFTPSFIDLPYSPRFQSAEGTLQLDRADWLAIAERTKRLGEEKQAFIGEIFHRMNATILRTSDSDKELLKKATLNINKQALTAYASNNKIA